MSLNNIKPNPTPAGLLDAQGRDFETLSYVEWKAIETCDTVLRKHGMQMQIICEDCLQAGHPQPYVMGDNERGSGVIEMKCAHKRRRCLLA